MDIIKIGNYSIIKTTQITKINYKRSINDWFNIIGSLLFGLLFIGVTLYFIFVYDTNNDYSTFYICMMNLLISLIFGFTGFLIVRYSFKKIFNTRSSIAEINKGIQSLVFKISVIKTIRLNFSDIKKFDLHGHLEISKGEDGTTSRWSYCELFVCTYSNEKYFMHPFDSESLLNKRNEVNGNTELYSTAKKVSKIISEECDSIYNWHRSK